jgi:hypothetical protein
MSDNDIPATFLQYAADLLGDTSKGLSGSDIVRATAAYAVEYDVRLPHPIYPFEAANKRTALYENLRAFTPAQQYRIIRELCEHRSFSLASSPERNTLKIRLATRYAHLSTDHPSSDINESLVEETRHWLQDHPSAQSLYNQALAKLEAGAFHRNLLDDLRLSLEKLLQSVFENHKSLENQIPSVGSYIKSCGGSSEFTNMFVKLIDYYAKYQNAYVKHDDAVIEPEIEFVFEITSSFMKHLIRLGGSRR